MMALFKFDKTASSYFLNLLGEDLNMSSEEHGRQVFANSFK